MLSSKQIAANQNNALMSTGPKTPEGKAASKMNALKHGIRSKEVLVRGLNVRENPRGLDALYERFWEDLNPVGPMEELLVDQIVTAYWRKLRALRAESGEIALSVDLGQWARRKIKDKWQVEQWGETGDFVRAMQESALGISIQASWLREICAQVEKEGTLKKKDIKEFVVTDQPNLIAQGLNNLRLKFAQIPNGEDQASRREECKKQALAYIDRQLTMRIWRQAACEKREKAEEESRQAAAVLPSPEVLDKILRYETKLDRQIYRAMSQLERLQRIRRGEAVPPPISMEVAEAV
jgi:hypothetical protein